MFRWDGARTQARLPNLVRSFRGGYWTTIHWFRFSITKRCINMVLKSRKLMKHERRRKRKFSIYSSQLISLALQYIINLCLCKCHAIHSRTLNLHIVASKIAHFSCGRVTICHIALKKILYAPPRFILIICWVTMCVSACFICSFLLYVLSAHQPSVRLFHWSRQLWHLFNSWNRHRAQPLL